MEQGNVSTLMNLLPLVIMTIPLGFIARMLAREKGRNVTLWTVLGFVPLINYFCLAFFIGAVNLRLEKKLDQLLELQGKR
ncbi:hypothetical protein [Thiomonas sp. FB-6]|uniref:hypothetical protein n=1 Tax=Thiomonas sp. FB-6 TaxID=1158291 RepID=UPI0012DF423E|nr:hypothetical protein [Thiomonas sp. FB-6]